MNLSILKQNNLENALFLRVYTVPFPPKAIFYSSKSHFWIFEWYYLPTFYFGLFFFLFYIKQLSIFQCLQLFFNTGYLNKTFLKKKGQDLINIHVICLWQTLHTYFLVSQQLNTYFCVSVRCLFSDFSLKIFRIF